MMIQPQPTQHDLGTLEIWAELIRELSRELAWGLGPQAEAGYSAALSHIAAGRGAAARRRLALNYHHDHALVNALVDPGHPKHQHSWSTWMPQVLAILRHAGLRWDDDGSMDLDDLAQVARLELARSLPDFRYESRLSTWAYGVVIRSARRELRDRAALKRAARPDSLERAGEPQLPAHERDAPHAFAESRLLTELVASVLGAQPDGRLFELFRLWAVEERRVADIGARVGLSEPRVRALLAQCVALLRSDPQIQAWGQDPTAGPVEAAQRRAPSGGARPPVEGA